MSKKKACGKLCFSVSIWRNRLPNRIECLWRPMAIMLYQKQRAEIGFAGSMTTILTWVTRSVKIVPGRLRTVNCRLFWTRMISQKMFAEQLGVSQAAISMRLHAMGKVQKIGKWVPHKLNDRQMPKHMPNSACQTKKKVPASDCDRRWKVDLFSES